MWRPGVVLLTLALFANQSHAQSLFIGVRAGQTSSRQLLRFPGPVSFPESISADVFGASGINKTGKISSAATSGLSFALDFNAVVGVEGELLFVEKGMRENGAEMRLAYIEMPILARLAVPVSDMGVHLFIHGGPAPSQEASCRGRQTFDGRTFAAVDCNNWRETKRDFGWALGGGLLIRQPLYELTASWRNTRGTRDLEPKSDFIERFNSTSAFLIGFVARLK